jgi:hypothetical protein
MRPTSKVGTFVIVLLALVFVSPASAQWIPQNKGPSEAGCPTTRYLVRFGRDSDAGLVDLSSITPTTIEEIRSWPAPSTRPEANRIAPYETRVLALDATLIEYQLGLQEDSDYRLVLADESGRTVVAKISSPDCALWHADEPWEAGYNLPESRFLAGINSSRAEFTDWLFPGTEAEHAAHRVRVLAVGMFDALTGETGESPNGFQLAPVLDIVFDPEEREPIIRVPVSRHPR